MVTQVSKLSSALKTASAKAPIRARILLVDDDERNLMALSEALGGLGDIVTATSGREALRHLLKGDFAVKSRVNSMWFHMGPNANQRERAYIGTMTATALGFRAGNKIITISSPGQANATIGIVDTAH